MFKQSKCWGLCIITTNYIQQLVYKDDTSFTLNQSQCMCLAQTLEQTIKNIIGLFSHVNELPIDFDLLLTELFRIIERAKLLVQQCCSEKWWHAALLQFNNEEAFQDLIMDLICCYDDIFQHSQGLWGILLGKHKLDVMSFSLDTMRKLATNDQHALIRQLHAIIKTTQSSSDNNVGRDDESTIATYLMQRFDMQEINVEGGHHVEVDARLGWGDSIQIGGGVFGKVEKSTWFGFPCARKVQILGDSEGGDKIFKKEVAILARVNHPNVVKLICCGRKPRKLKCFIAMELLDTSLENLIKKLSNDGTRAPFPLPAAVDIILQIAKGMSYLHGKNIVHRDLKPDNVLVNKIMVEELHEDNYVHVKLADFGLSKMDVHSISYENLSRGLGSRLYKAPELFQNTEHDTKRSMYSILEMDKVNAHEADVYSFGVMCSTILSGRKPFDNNGYDLHERLKSGERPWLPDNCPEPLVSLINECWSLQRTKRPKFKEICTTLKDLRSSILKGNIALTNQDFETGTSMYQKISNLPHNVIYWCKWFWTKPKLEANEAAKGQHTNQVNAQVTIQICIE